MNTYTDDELIIGARLAATHERWQSVVVKLELLGAQAPEKAYMLRDELLGTTWTQAEVDAIKAETARLAARLSAIFPDPAEA